MEEINMGGIPISALIDRDTTPVYGKGAKDLIHGKTVLVTGAGGSIGSEIVRQLITLGAGKIFCVDQDEYALYCLQRELSGAALLDDETIILADIRDSVTMSRIFSMAKPDLVYHAAAHKHLPLLERSPIAAIKTNVLGTEVIAKACIEHRVKRFINISTDKAARPTSVLGMTKRIAEMATAMYAGGNTKMASVRFGNVLGSRGSFLPTLAWQIAHGKTVSVTHPDVSRFFMTIPEAAALVIEASVLASRGETYILNMGTSIKIVDLIKKYVELTKSKSPEIVYTGLRMGEKMHEELYDPSEEYMPTAHDRISMVQVNKSGSISLRDLRKLREISEIGYPVPELRFKLEKMVEKSEFAMIMGKPSWIGFLSSFL